MELSGATYPKEATPLEGSSLLASFQNKTSPRGPLFWEHEGNCAVRIDNWKLVAKHNQPWELYNLAEDRVERIDLAKANPDRVKTMITAYDAFAKRANVEPWADVNPAKKANE
jgi:arylsulfatase